MTTPPYKGVRGFELDIHVAFTQLLPRAAAAQELLVLDGFRVDLYQPHPNAMPREVDVTDAVPSARLTGPLRDQAAVRAGLAALLTGSARYVEVGLRGFLRSVDGQTEWMPWRRNVVLQRHDLSGLTFEEGVRYVLE